MNLFWSLLGPFESILGSIETPWSLFWSLYRRASAVGARRPRLARTVQDCLGVYSGVYWDLLDYSGVYWASLESIQESIRAPCRRPDSGSQENQPSVYLGKRIRKSIGIPWNLFWNLLALLGVYSGVFSGSLQEVRQWEPGDPAWRLSFRTPLKFILVSIGPPWSQFWNLLRLLGRVPAVGARRPSLATIVQDSLGVYSGVYWSHGLYSGIYWDLLDYSGVYWVSLESIQESIGAPSRRPDSGSHESQPGAHRLARRSSLAPWSLF